MKADQQDDRFDGLFNPRSVAIIGASDDPTKIAGRPLAAMRQSRFAGNVYAVNARRAQVQGDIAYPDLVGLPETPELAIICLPAQAAVQAVADCASAGVKYAVVFAGGFAEAGEAGRQMQLTLQASARTSGMRILGPNCLGVMDFGSQLFATFSRAADEKEVIHTTGLALVSQSGALGNYVLTQATDLNVPVSKWVATGNEADIEFAEMIEAMADEPSVRGILAYLEGARDGPRLRRAFSTAKRAGKPIALIKVGATDVGAKAIVSHTDALAGDDAVYDALFARYGVHRAQTIEELLDLGLAMAHGRPTANRKILLATISGGVGAIMAEAAVRSGLELPELSEAARRQLQQALPFMSPANPLDVTGQLVQDFSLLETALSVGLQDTGAGIVVSFIGRLARMPAALARYQKILADLSAQYPDVVFATVGMFTPGTQNTSLAFSDPSRAVAAVSALARWGTQFAQTDDPVDDPSSWQRPDPGASLDEAQCYALLTELGLTVPDHRVAESVGQAVDSWRELGEQSVALKVLAGDLAHKSDIGGVALRLSDSQAIQTAYETLGDRVSAATDGRHGRRVLVAAMQTVEVELMIGARIDPQLGPVVMVGAGGVLIELLEDVQIACAPVTPKQARAMVMRLRCASLLKAWRGRQPLDIEAVVQAVVILAGFAAANQDWLDSIEINPLAPAWDGQGAVALDCVISRQVKTASTP